MSIEIEIGHAKRTRMISKETHFKIVKNSNQNETKLIEI